MPTHPEHTRFAGANALIFGAAKGIGRGVARECARRGARVAIADIDEAAAGEAAELVVADGGTAIALHADALSEQSIAEAVAAGEAAFGLLDIVMSNVGAMLNGHPEDIPMAEWQRMMDLNYFAAVRTLGLVLPKMLARGRGHIVHTASFAGLYPYAASRLPYASAKAAVIALSQSLAIYAEPLGVRVSCLVPGPVLTGVMDSMTTWTADCAMRGPGAELELKTVEEVATRLADGMEAGAILIPSDDTAWDILRRWAADPDAFLRDKIAAFAAGDTGRPHVPEALLRAMGQQP
jgi:NAD(P)-dependent dehydrogenase (short-subunit alcohol dehydrogenase family)